MKRIRFFLFFLIFILLGSFSGIYSAVSPIDYAKNILHSQPILKSLFIPDKEIDAEKVLIGIINSEQEGIYVAQFILNNKKIAEALCEAFDRGVKIAVILDQGSLRQKSEKVTMLKDKGIDIVIYKRPFSIMHNKYYVFTKNLNDNPLVFTGSANATFSGFKKNQENVVISDDVEMVEEYKNKFRALRQELLKTKIRIIESIIKTSTQLIATNYSTVSKKIVKQLSKTIPK